MRVECFLDTNIFIYLFDNTDARKRGVAEQLVQDRLRRNNACISHQVVQETLNVLVGKLHATQEQAAALLDHVLGPLWQVHPSQTLYRDALALKARYGYGFYDSLILAAALDAGCKVLYSEDLQHGQRIRDLRIENPFFDPKAL